VQLTDRVTSELQHLGNRCLHFTWKSRGTVSLEGLELQVSRLLVHFANGAHGIHPIFLIQLHKRITRYAELRLKAFLGIHLNK